jgi:hypothetical protein
MNKSIEIKGEEAAENRTQRKKAYHSPKMVEYGNVAKLTQGSSGTVGDGTGMNMPPCL